MTDYKDVYEPCFSVQIEGKLLTTVQGVAEIVDVTQHITSFTFDDAEDELDECTIEMANINGQWTDHELFQEGNLLVCRWGYVNDLSPKMTLVIKKIAYSFGQDAPTITITAHDKAHDLSQKTRQETYVGQTYPQIATTIAKSYGLTPVVKAHSTKLDQVNQANMDDIAFLKKLAKRINYVVYVQNNELHFHPPNDQAPSAMTLSYFLDNSGMLLTFDPEVDTEGTKSGSKVTGKAWNLKENAPVTEAVDDKKAASEQTKLVEGKTYLIDAGAGESKFQDRQTGKHTPMPEGSSISGSKPSEVKDKATAEKIEKASHELTAQATTIGIPSLCAKSVITLEGEIGRKFRGNYYITHCTHVIDGGGYGCSLDLKRAGVGDIDAKAGVKEGVANTEPGPKDKAKSPEEVQYRLTA